MSVVNAYDLRNGETVTFKRSDHPGAGSMTGVVYSCGSVPFALGHKLTSEKTTILEVGQA